MEGVWQLGVPDLTEPIQSAERHPSHPEYDPMKTDEARNSPIRAPQRSVYEMMRVSQPQGAPGEESDDVGCDGVLSCLAVRLRPLMCTLLRILLQAPLGASWKLSNGFSVVSRTS